MAGFRIDLHTHSSASPDGGLRPQDYSDMLERGGLQAIAVTDHDRIDMALQLQQELGERIIVGEEIRCRQGELVGLYLSERIKPGQDVLATAEAIRQQGGLVYVPHPFETVRSGISQAALQSISQLVDIIETHNGRAVFQNRGELARQYRDRYDWVGAAASDAHSRHGWGRTYTTLGQAPTRQNLVELLRQAAVVHRHPGARGLLAPKLNRLRKRMGRV